MTREEAINEIKSWDFLEGKEIEAIQTLIPELRESEDERIRKEIIDFIQWAEDRGMTRHDYHQAKRPAVWIAYLEKQKELPFVKDVVLGLPGLYFYDGERMHFRGSLAMEEKHKEPEDVSASTMIPSCWEVEQKPAEWDEEDKHNLNSVINLVHATTDGAWGSCIGDRIENWLKNLPKRFNLSSKQEWSEEDEEMLNSCISSIEESKENRYAYKETDGDTSYDREVDWLKSLRPQSKQKQNDYITPHKEFFKFIYDRLINVHKENPNVDYMRSFKERLNNLSFGEKQEWSEEDIDKMVYERARKSGTTKTEMHFYRQGIEDTLKSLRPSWKPSEEQMKALYCAIEDVAKFSKRGGRQVELENESYYSALHSLYCNLEKLM